MKCESNPQFYLPQSEHIQYKIDLDDIRAFANSYSQNSKFMKGFVQIIYVMYISMVILCGLWMGHYDSLHTIFVNSAEFLVFVVAFIFVIKKYAIPKSAMALFKKSFPENDAHGVQMEAGVFGIEMFLTKDGKVLINEIAPRVHNSGHYTIEASVTSQFEQHIRAITGLPLGSTDLIVKSAVMKNILGEHEGSGHPKGIEKALKIPGVSYHLYNKKNSKIGRKMGHITVVGDSAKVNLQKANKARKALQI
jgi:hypothetical protein